MKKGSMSIARKEESFIQMSEDHLRWEGTTVSAIPSLSEKRGTFKVSK